MYFPESKRARKALKHLTFIEVPDVPFVDPLPHPKAVYETLLALACPIPCKGAAAGDDPTEWHRDCERRARQALAALQLPGVKEAG